MSKKQQPSIKRKKPYGAIAAVAAAAVLLAVMPTLARRDQNVNNAVTSFQVTGGVIETNVHAGGTLTDRQAYKVTIPEDIDLELAVKNGERVSKGDLIAKADKTELMQAIASLEEKLGEIDKEIEDARDSSDAEKLTASASGRVKAIYAEEGQSVAQTMFDHGALVLISLDGHMAVDVYCPRATVGVQMDVTLSDGTVVTGTVASLSGDNVTVTISDKEGALGEKVSLSDRDGKSIGEGELYIHSELAVTGYYGTVKSLKVKVNDTVDAGDILASLSDTDGTAAYADLLNHRSLMEEQLRSLFEMYHTGGIYAEMDGIIAEINDKDFSLEKTSAGGSRVVPLSNSPTGVEGYINYAAMAVEVSGSTLKLRISPVAISELDYSNAELLKNLTYDSEMTTFELPAGTPVYSYTEGVWGGGSIAAGNYLVFAFSITDEGSQLVWVVSHPVVEEPEDPDTPEEPDDPEDPDDPENPDDPAEGGTTTPTVPSIPSIPNIPTMPSMPEFDFSFGDYANAFGGLMYPQTGTEEESSWLLREVDVCTVTADTDMTVTLSVDEADLGHIRQGMEVQLELDALPDQLFTAVVTSIADASQTTYGSAKYPVEITIARTAEMRAGMNAVVTVPVETREVECAVPLAALFEKNGRTFVYFAYNESDGVFENEVEVITGISDGSMVEIVSGIQPGDTVWYEYVEVQEYSFI